MTGSVAGSQDHYSSDRSWCECPVVSGLPALSDFAVLGCDSGGGDGYVVRGEAMGESGTNVPRRRRIMYAWTSEIT